MNKDLLKLASIFCCIIYPNLCAVSLVYNLKIAETTRRQALEQEQHPNYTIAAIIGVEQWRKRHDGAHLETSGGLGTLIHVPTPFYVRADFAVGRVSQRVPLLDNKKFSRVQTDDILFSAGYSHMLGGKSKITVSGLLGIPTHKDTGFQAYQLSTGHVGIGAQLDAALFYSDDPGHSLMGAARFVRFCKRTVDIDILTIRQQFEFELGNLADLLIAHTSKWGKHHTEIGYNATFGFGANLRPPIPDLENQLKFTYSSFYANYKYQFLINNKYPSVFAAGVSYAFDHLKNLLNLKYSITVWGSWGFAF